MKEQKKQFMDRLAAYEASGLEPEEVSCLARDLDCTRFELSQYQAAHGDGKAKIIPNNQPVGRWIEVKTLLHAAGDGSAFCYQLQYKCPECGALEDRARKYCPECGADMVLKEG